MRAIIWPHRYDAIKPDAVDWIHSLCWVTAALSELGVEVHKHPGLEAELPGVVESVLEEPGAYEVAIFTHAIIDHLPPGLRDIAPLALSFKSTGPSWEYASLDPVGYGPCSSISYDEPDYESAQASEVDEFFETKVADWIKRRTNKWGWIQSEAALPPFPEYDLILAQTLGDETVSGMAFGSYRESLLSMVREAVRVSPVPVVVKLHPWTDGESGATGPYTLDLGEDIEALGAAVVMGMFSVHDLLARARCVLLCNSGAGIEALLHGKPIVSWGHPEYHWVTGELRHLTQLKGLLASGLSWHDPGAARAWLWWYCELYCVSDPSSALRRCGELLGLGALQSPVG